MNIELFSLCFVFALGAKTPIIPPTSAEFSIKKVYDHPTLMIKFSQQEQLINLFILYHSTSEYVHYASLIGTGLLLEEQKQSLVNKKNPSKKEVLLCTILEFQCNHIRDYLKEKCSKLPWYKKTLLSAYIWFEKTSSSIHHIWNKNYQSEMDRVAGEFEWYTYFEREYLLNDYTTAAHFFIQQKQGYFPEPLKFWTNPYTQGIILTMLKKMETKITPQGEGAVGLIKDMEKGGEDAAEDAANDLKDDIGVVAGTTEKEINFAISDSQTMDKAITTPASNIIEDSRGVLQDSRTATGDIKKPENTPSQDSPKNNDEEAREEETPEETSEDPKLEQEANEVIEEFTDPADMMKKIKADTTTVDEMGEIAEKTENIPMMKVIKNQIATSISNFMKDMKSAYTSFKNIGSDAEKSKELFEQNKIMQDISTRLEEGKPVSEEEIQKWGDFYNVKSTDGGDITLSVKSEPQDDINFDIEKDQRIESLVDQARAHKEDPEHVEALTPEQWAEVIDYKKDMAYFHEDKLQTKFQGVKSRLETDPDSVSEEELEQFSYYVKTRGDPGDATTVIKMKEATTPKRTTWDKIMNNPVKQWMHSLSPINHMIADIVLQLEIMQASSLIQFWYDMSNEALFSEKAKRQAQMVQFNEHFTNLMTVQQTHLLTKAHLNYLASLLSMRQKREDASALILCESFWVQQSIYSYVPPSFYTHNANFFIKETTSLNRNINNSQTQALQDDIQFSLSTMLTPESLTHGVFKSTVAGAWHNVIRQGNWQFYSPLRSFFQLETVPFHTSQNPSAVALSNSIFKDYIPVQQDCYTYSIDLTLHNYQFPFFIGFMFNKGRWISGVQDKYNQMRFAGIYGATDKNCYLVFEESLASSTQEIAQGIPITQSPLYRIINDEKKYTLLPYKITIGALPYSYNLVVSYYDISDSDKSSTAAVTFTSTSKPFTKKTIIARDFSPNNSLQHGIGFIAAGCAGSFTITQPIELTYSDADIASFENALRKIEGF